MGEEDFSISFKKYLDLIVKPKFPQISEIVVIREADRPTPFGWSQVYNIRFFVNSRDEEFKDDVRAHVKSMKSYLGVPDDVSLAWGFTKV